MRGPYVVFSATSQSHPFDDRRIKVNGEDDPLKIGRSVARLKPATDNAIFDCKVLSRNHAVMWFSDGAFYLRDTKSSNGTFVNSERLSQTGEESEPRQVHTGDIVQFGVEIVENQNKVAHGCIFAMIRLHDHDGKEIVDGDAIDERVSHSGHGAALVSTRQLFQMQQYIKEAMFREKSRQQKLDQLESILEATERASEAGWKALVNEDRLLSRIEMLESQLALYSKNAHTDKVKEDMNTLILDRSKAESAAKENMRRATEEKAEAHLRLGDLERSLATTEEECNRVSDKCVDLERRAANALAELERSDERAAAAARAVDEHMMKMKEMEARATLAEHLLAEATAVRDSGSVSDRVQHLLAAIHPQQHADDELLKALCSAIQIHIGLGVEEGKKGEVDGLEKEEETRQETNQPEGDEVSVSEHTVGVPVSAGPVLESSATVVEKTHPLVNGQCGQEEEEEEGQEKEEAGELRARLAEAERNYEHQLQQNVALQVDMERVVRQLEHTHQLLADVKLERELDTREQEVREEMEQQEKEEMDKEEQRVVESHVRPVQLQLSETETISSPPSPDRQAVEREEEEGEVTRPDPLVSTMLMLSLAPLLALIFLLLHPIATRLGVVGEQKEKEEQQKQKEKRKKNK